MKTRSVQFSKVKGCADYKLEVSSDDEIEDAIFIEVSDGVIEELRYMLHS